MTNPTFVAATFQTGAISAGVTTVAVSSNNGGSLALGNAQVLVIAIAGATAPSGITPPGGWQTALATTVTAAGGNVVVGVYYQQVQAAGLYTGNVNWTTNSTGGFWAMMEFANSTFAIIDGSPTTTLNSSGTSPTSPSITPGNGAKNDTLLSILVGGALSASTVTIPGGESSILASSGSGTQPLLGIASLALSSSSATSAETWTLGTAQATLGVSLLMQQPLPAWGFDATGNPSYITQSRIPSVKNRHVATKGRAEFAIFANPPPTDWLVTPPQPPRFAPTRQRGAAIMRGDDGVEQQKPPTWYSAGWEIQPVQPPHRGNERKAGAIMKGDEGTELPKPPTWYNSGWEIASFQPPGWPRQWRFGAIAPKDDGIEGIKPPTWYNTGWEILAFQPPHPKPEHEGGIMRGDDGIELPFIPPVGTVVGCFDPFQPPPYKVKRPLTAAIVGGDQGIESPFVSFQVSLGFEAQLPIIPPPYTTRPSPFVKMAALTGSAQGTETPFVSWKNAGWEIASFQPPQLRQERGAAIMPGDQGIEAQLPATVILTSAWGFEPVVPLLSISRRIAMRYPATKGRAEFAIFPASLTTGWEVAAPQMRTRNTKAAGIAKGDDGIEGVYNFVPPATITSAWGFDPASFQPTFRPTIQQRAVAAGGESVFAAFSTLPWVDDDHTLHYKRPHRTFDPSETGIENKFAPPALLTSGWGFDPMPVQLPRKVYRAGALARFDEGIESPQINFFPTGWEITPHQPEHPRPEKAGAIMPSDTGAENVYTFVQLFLSPWGYDTAPVQPPHPRPAKAGALVRGLDGTESPLVNFFPFGWPIAPHQPGHPRPERSGAIMPSDQGTEAPYVFVPLFLSPWGYDTAPVQPPHPRPERAGAIIRGDDGTQGPLVNFFPFAWPIAPVQPPHPKPERSGAIAAGDQGIEAPLVAPPVLSNYALDYTPLNYRKPVNRAGALARGQEAPDAPFVSWVLLDWRVLDVNQRPRPRVHAALQTKWDIDAVFNFVPLPPLTGYVSNPDYVIPKRVKFPGGALPQQDGGWYFPHFVSVFYATTIITQASGITTVSAASAQTVVRGEPTGR